MIDPNTLRAQAEASRIANTGIGLYKEAAPEVVEENRKKLKHEVRKKNIICFILLFAGIVISIVVFEGDTFSFIIGFGITLIVSAFFGLQAKKLEENACPKCFAMSSWVHFKTWESGQQRTSVTKEVETKHYSSDRKPLAGFGLSSGPHRYTGKSVTRVTVPAVRYDYCERYICKCCGQIRDIHTHKVVEQ